MNWKNIVTELLATGLTQQQLADLAGCSQNMISDLYLGKKGERLGYSIGKSLVDLHQERCLITAKTA